MSHAKNKVEWCLKKAKRELEEGLKHRGIVEIKPSIDEAKQHLKKAEHNIKALLSFEKTGFSDWSTSAAFYTIYHCFLAILAMNGYESRNQACTIAAMQYLKEEDKTRIDDKLIEALEEIEPNQAHESNVIELREIFQYGTETHIDDKRLEQLKLLCKEAIAQTKREIYPEGEQQKEN